MDVYVTMKEEQMKSNIPPENKSYLEKRNETRYICVGLPAMYSPVINDAIENFGSLLHNAALQDVSFSGLGFNVDAAMEKGEIVVLVLDSPENADKQLLVATVCWCKKLENNSYRIGVQIDISEPVQQYKNAMRFTLKVEESDIPQEVSINCPACKQASTFDFIALQPLIINKGVMPLYSCSKCGTTRTLLGIFMTNHKNVD